MQYAQAPLGRLAAFTAGLSWETLPPEVQEAAAFRVLDLVSVSVGASGDPLVEQMKKALRELNPEVPQRGAALFGEPGSQWSPENAAFLNAMLAHTLELDDVHPASKNHASACLIPAAWSLGQFLQVTGPQLLTAVVAGYETAFRIGMAFGVAAHRKRGWHATATCGIFGAAAACAQLLRLTPEQTASALGLAGSQSTGVWAFLGDGTNSKVLNPAHAAACGLRSAYLAKYGLTGPVHILEAQDGGLLGAMSDGGQVEKVCAGLGETWEILRMDMKPYPCCRSAHGGIDGALQLRQCLLTGREQGRDAEAQAVLERTESLTAATYKIGYQQCAVSAGCLHPKTPGEAKFSLPYALAHSLLYGRVDGSSFTPEAVQDPRLQALLPRITVTEDPELTAAYPDHWSCRTTLRLKNGQEVTAWVEDPTGSYRRPLSPQAALDKAESLLAHKYPHGTRALAQSLLDLAQAQQLPRI